MATQDEKGASDLGDQAIALAEQLGHIVGTIEGTAQSWAAREKLADQLTRVRDGATQLLDGLTAQAERSRSAAMSAVRKVRPTAAKRGAARNPKTATTGPATATRQSDPSHAPGKRRRKPAPSMRGVKKSDERIPKMRTATAVRQRRKNQA
jgi:hypothetical protein